MATGVLLIQLGTPDEPTVPALRRYLRQFLGDRRVIDAPRVIWWFVLNFLILPSRPRQSAAKYARIWDQHNGSPLLYLTKRQTEALQRVLSRVPVRFGMQIGQPSLADVVRRMIRDEGVDRLVVLPMYPQYSATTTASAYDVLFKALMEEKRVPALRVVPPYYEHPAYLDAVATLVQEQLVRLSQPPEHYLLSFHGIPIRYCQRTPDGGPGDLYATHVKRTTRALVPRLGWHRGQWTQSFQSLFGREEWLKPYTDSVLERLARKGIRRVFIATPGFTTDCLETLDEIGNEANELFHKAGGTELIRCPCLNDHPKWIEAMAHIIRDEARDWLD
jgi:ferrochelatase